MVLLMESLEQSDWLPNKYRNMKKRMELSTPLSAWCLDISATDISATDGSATDSSATLNAKGGRFGHINKF